MRKDKASRVLDPKKATKKTVSPARMTGELSAMCAQGKHGECSASACRCKKCPCEFN